MSTNQIPSILILIAALTFSGTSPAQPLGSSGTIVSTVDAEGYTYVQMDIDGSKVWFAAPTVELAIGATVKVPAGMPMKDFYSKTLDRTFDMVYFVDSITLPNAPKPESSDLPTGHPPITTATAAAAFDFSGIEKPEGAKTVAEINQSAATLAGQNVMVRGIAVKVSNGIMGKNWIHLQDGTGDSGMNDLTITSTNTVKPGTTITASGNLATNLDFGYGYTYAVLLEDAAIETK